MTAAHTPIQDQLFPDVPAGIDVTATARQLGLTAVTVVLAAALWDELQIIPAGLWHMPTPEGAARCVEGRVWWVVETARGAWHFHQRNPDRPYVDVLARLDRVDTNHAWLRSTVTPGTTGPVLLLDYAPDAGPAQPAA
jgi:hypothetical protein